MKVEELVFPVFAISPSGSVDIYKDAKGLKTCTPLGLRRGGFSGLSLISVDGSRYVVKSADEIEAKKPWWRQPVFFVTLLTVTLNIEKVGSVTPDELKELLQKSFRTDPKSWEFCGVEYGEFAAELNKHESLAQLTDYIVRTQYGSDSTSSPE